jgi:single-strand DNA-binding protein
MNMINEVRLMGRLARDPDLRSFSNGGAVCNLRVITSRSWTDSKTGMFKENIQGHNVAILVAPIANRAKETLTKGSLVYIAGTLETRKWEDSDGNSRYTTEVVIRPFQGTLRKIPSNSVNSGGSAEKPSEETPDVEIDYMAELGSIGTFSLGGDNPFD